MEEIEKIIKQQEEGFEAEITKVEKTNSNKFYESVDEEGNKVKSVYDKRDGYAISYKLIDKDGINEPVEWTEFYAIPKPQGFGHKDCKIGNFYRRYGVAPKIGFTVKAVINENGFFRADF